MFIKLVILHRTSDILAARPAFPLYLFIGAMAFSSTCQGILILIGVKVIAENDMGRKGATIPNVL